MKVADLVIGKTQNDVLTLTGKNLAKMYRKFGITPTFGQFVQEQSLLEVGDINDLHELHAGLLQVCQSKNLGIETINFSVHFQDRVLPGGRDQIFNAKQILFVFSSFVTGQTKKMMDFIKEDQEKPSTKGVEVLIKCNRLDMNMIFAIKNRGTHIEFMTLMKKKVAAFGTDDRPWTKTVFV